MNKLLDFKLELKKGFMPVSEDSLQSANSVYKSSNHIQSDFEQESLLGEHRVKPYYTHKPVDHYNCTYIIFFILGVGASLPWNFFCTAKHYWIFKFRNCTDAPLIERHDVSDISVSLPAGKKTNCRRNGIGIASVFRSCLTRKLQTTLQNRSDMHGIPRAQRLDHNEFDTGSRITGPHAHIDPTGFFNLPDRDLVDFRPVGWPHTWANKLQIYVSVGSFYRPVYGALNYFKSAFYSVFSYLYSSTKAVSSVYPGTVKLAIDTKIRSYESTYYRTFPSPDPPLTIKIKVLPYHKVVKEQISQCTTSDSNRTIVMSDKASDSLPLKIVRSAIHAEILSTGNRNFLTCPIDQMTDLRRKTSGLSTHGPKIERIHDSYDRIVASMASLSLLPPQTANYLPLMSEIGLLPADIQVSSKVRILSSLVVMLLIFILTAVLAKIDTSAWTKEFFVLTLSCVVILSGASNILAASIFGVTGQFPMKNSQALISGQAMGGTISALAAILDLTVASNVTDSALAYFLTAVIFTLICIIMYLILPRMEYSRYYLNISNDRPPSSSLESASAGNSHSTLEGNSPPIGPILRKVRVLATCLFYNFFISIIIFPTISASIESVNSESGSIWTTKYFTPITCFFIYNFADFCGRQITAWIQSPGPNSKILPTLVFLRTLFIPLFMFCNYQPRKHINKVLFQSDVYPVLFISLLGLSNGYLGTLSMIYGPKVVPKELAEGTAIIMSFFLGLGLAVGSAFSSLAQLI
ncbi:hypothetical protein XELAEV_18037168mg [Xenopus laevis]|uniref:Equilibrative nucleoside transporter 3 n=1 Tax=Xenopus laevis TaxID=8355 RepID=A0A974HAE3_XENLA|nr:hypothetical protein XELAEV_18037168mg [Xenopus laevis]